VLRMCFFAYVVKPLSECVSSFVRTISGKYSSLISLGMRCLMQVLVYFLLVVSILMLFCV
jgi:hypothetical protein